MIWYSSSELVILLLGCKICSFCVDVIETVFIKVQFGHCNKTQNNLI